MVGIEVSREDTSCWDVDVFEYSVDCIGKSLIVAWLFIINIEEK